MTQVENDTMQALADDARTAVRQLAGYARHLSGSNHAAVSLTITLRGEDCAEDWVADCAGRGGNGATLMLAFREVGA